MKPHPVPPHPRHTLSVLFPVLLGVLLPSGQGFAPVAWAQDAAAAPPIRKVLFLGNSITLHGPKQDIDWPGNWGMAASSADKDYVHLVTHALSRTTGVAPQVMVRNIAKFERQYATFDVESELKDAAAFEADLIILAIAENVPKLEAEEAKDQFRRSLLRLVRYVQAGRHPALVVRGSFFRNKDEHDRILKQVCEEAGGVFVDISHLGKDESNYARSERPYKHKGVAAHPGDKGMQAIAGAILEALGPKFSPGARAPR